MMCFDYEYFDMTAK